MRHPDNIARTGPFWIMFAISAAGALTNAATTPVIPLYAERDLASGSAVAGLVIALGSLASMIGMPAAGFLGDRFGYRIVSVIGGIVAVIGLCLPTLHPSLTLLIAGRVVFGLGSASALTLTMTWLVALTPAGQRGRALSIFGLSVWMGVALGPQVGTWMYALAGAAGVFLVTGALTAVATAMFILLPPPQAAVTTASITLPSARPSVWRTFTVVWVPGVVAAAAWCGEGLLLGFAIVHLESRGVAATGILGAANIFGVFAVSVIVARLLLARMPDRIGPLRATVVSLLFLATGLTTLALATDFWVAALGAASMGLGFSPLYPSLTMLASRGLRSVNRALGLGIFSSFTSVGYAGGALIGGAVLATTESYWAFLLVAGLQLAALLVVVLFTADESPRGIPDMTPPRDPAA